MAPSGPVAPTPTAPASPVVGTRHISTPQSLSQQSPDLTLIPVEPPPPLAAASTRKRAHVPLSDQDCDFPHLKRRKTTSVSPTAPAITANDEDQQRSQAAFDVRIAHWVHHATWPAGCFDSTFATWQDFDQATSSMDDFAKPYPVDPNRRKRSEPTPTGSSCSESRDRKSSFYRNIAYRDDLQRKGSYMTEAKAGITTASKELCQSLLEGPQKPPLNSLFDDAYFEETCGKLQGRGEARVVQDIARLLVPSAETLATRGAAALDCLIENVDETWTESVPFQGPKPKPDYSVGFRESAFPRELWDKLQALAVFEYRTSGYFSATHRMCFPFLTCEVKCGEGSLSVADRQNAHSMTLAVRAVVELFRAVGRHHELHREILAFSISHDDSFAQLYGHYALIEGTNVSYYRHPIDAYSFTVRGGRQRWTTYQFTKNIYDLWMPKHLDRICSAIRDLPEGVDFRVASLPEDMSSRPADSQTSSVAGSTVSPVTPDTSFVQSASSKKPKTG